ncbi:MAG: hypothetical protein ACLTBR_01145 [Anaerostipes sp.]|uniref:hypothetical protein n=1 Tax=Anaerostipes sp. TaxID=1872530 RepID=UPI00399375DF
MREPYFDSGGTDAEVIAVLNAISQVSARMARNMTILAKQRQSKKGEIHHEQNERYGYDYRRVTQCSRCY